MTSRYLRVVPLLPILFAIVIDAMGFGLVYPMLTALFTEPSSTLLPATASVEMRQFFLAMGYFLFPLCMIFGASFMGDLSDVWGRKRVITLCMAGICFSFFLMGIGIVINSLVLLYVGRGLSGLMAGSQAIALAVVADLSPPKNKALNLSVAVLATALGIVFGPLIAGIFSAPAVFHAFGLSTPFFVAAGLALVATLWVGWWFRETFVRNAEKRIHWLRPFEVFVEAFAHRRIRFISLIFLFYQTGFAIYFAIILVLLQHRFQYQAWGLGVFNAWLGVALVIVLLTVPRFIMGRWDNRKICTLGFLFTALGILASSLPVTEWALWVMGFVTAAASQIGYTTLIAIYSDATDDQSQGWVMGIAWAMVAVSWTLAGASANLLSLLGPAGLLAVGGCLTLIGTLLMGGFALRKG